MAELEKLLSDALPVFALLGVVGVFGLIYVWFKKSQSESSKPYERIEGGGNGEGDGGEGEGG